MTYEQLRVMDLSTQYYYTMFDEIFKAFFNEDSKLNLEYKIEVLEWAIANRNTVYNHPNYEQDIMLENYPTEQIWDI